VDDDGRCVLERSSDQASMLSFSMLYRRCPEPISIVDG
jgi:hypothetical protein